MKVQIITDSSADLPSNFIERYNIQVVPLAIQFGSDTYLDQVEISNHLFYQKLHENDQLPKTSRPSPLAFKEAFLKGVEKGPVLCITLSSGLSGTYESALLAKKMLNQEIEVIDSLNASIGTGLQVIKACQMAEEGLTLKEIRQEIISYRNNMKTYFTLDTLENIIKGGRLSSWEGAIGQVLNIKPVLYNQADGTIGTLEKVRGRKKSLRRLLELVEATGKDFSECTIGITHARAQEEVSELVEELNNNLRPKEIIVSELGPVIGTHTGFGTILLAL
ncbi:MAG: DegV family protein [Clostridia bacterium]|nr:DegV family protein [Clostridia bacterium]